MAAHAQRSKPSLNFKNIKISSNIFKKVDKHGTPNLQDKVIPAQV